MSSETNSLNRRTFVRLTGMVAAGFAISPRKLEAASTPISLFDGKTLDGWSQIENNATSLSSAQVTDSTSFVHELATGRQPLSVFLRTQWDDTLKVQMTSYSASDANAKTVISALVKNLNQVISGPSIYDPTRFSSVSLRPSTTELLNHPLHGQQVAQLNKLLLEDAYSSDLAKSSSSGWVVKDGVMASTGSGRGVLYTAKDYSRYRLMFTMRHVSGAPDHQACVLIFCTRPSGDDKPLDALGGIQFQVPNGGHWDYRPGMNTAGGPEFTAVTKGQFDVHAWSRVEILADAAMGTARMAVAQPPGSKAIGVLNFNDPTAGKVGPMAWQMHNAGLFDEYKDITIELDPTDGDLLTTR